MDIFDGLTALGGLCLFLFGMQIMAEALQRRAGGRLEGPAAGGMTRSPPRPGFFTGLAVTAAVQSSSAAMVMVVGFVNSGMLTLRQAVGVIMGTNVGTTVTPWLLSLGGLEGGGVLGRLLRPAGFVPLLSLWGIAAYLAGKGQPPGHRPGPAGFCRSDAGHGDHDRRCIGPGPGGGVSAVVHGLRQPPAGGAGRGRC